jgi:hypothetical protein
MKTFRDLKAWQAELAQALDAQADQVARIVHGLIKQQRAL